MAFNIDEFKSKGLAFLGARPSLFQVSLNLPGLINQGSNQFQSKFAFTCSAASIPASTVDSIDVPYFGRKIKVPGDRTFADWTVTVMNDEDYLVRNAIEAWLNGLNSHVGNKRLLPANSSSPGTGFKTDAVISHFSKGGPNGSGGSNVSTGVDSIIKQYKFVGLFPTDVGAMQMAWDSTNTIQTFDITFAYDYWLPMTNNGQSIDTGASGGAGASVVVF